MVRVEYVIHQKVNYVLDRSQFRRYSQSAPTNKQAHKQTNKQTSAQTNKQTKNVGIR